MGYEETKLGDEIAGGGEEVERRSSRRGRQAGSQADRQMGGQAGVSGLLGLKRIPGISESRGLEHPIGSGCGRRSQRQPRVVE